MAEYGSIPLEVAAERLSKTPNAVRKLAQRGSIAAYKQGGRWYIRWPMDGSQQPEMAISEASSGQANEPARNEPASGEVAYLRAELSRAREELAEERKRHDEDRRRLDELIVEEGRRRDAILSALGKYLEAPKAPPAPAPEPERPQRGRWRWPWQRLNG